jgi:hypothetical protein
MYSGPNFGEHVILFVSRLSGKIDLTAKTMDLAIRLSLGLVGPNAAYDLLRIRLRLGHVRLLSLRT